MDMYIDTMCAARCDATPCDATPCEARRHVTRRHHRYHVRAPYDAARRYVKRRGKRDHGSQGAGDIRVPCHACIYGTSEVKWLGETRGRAMARMCNTDVRGERRDGIGFQDGGCSVAWGAEHAMSDLGGGA